MYVTMAGALGDNTLTRPKAPTTLRMRPVPYLCLDRFPFDKSTFTKRLDKMVNDLVAALTRSWTTSQPITSIRLIGHTDSTGTETYNVGLGDRRAAAVETALRKRLKGLASRVKISVQKSPGEMEPRRDNGTSDGRDVNRRVEVFVTVTPKPMSTTTKPDKPFTWEVREPTKSVIVTTPDPRFAKIPPGRAGRSLQDWVDDKLRRLPSWLRTRLRDAVIDGSCTVAAALLEQADLPGTDKNEIEKACKKFAQAKVQ